MTESPNPARKTPPLVLVVDDAPAILRLVRLTLSTLGVRVQTASTARDALVRFREMHPDLVLLDIRLPDASGLDVLRGMRQHSSLPVIALTAAADQSALSEIMASGADDIVRKPFSPDRLTAVVEHFIGRRPEGELDETVIRARAVQISLARETVTLRGEVVRLSRSEWLLLAALARRRGMPKLYQELLTEVWGPEYREDLPFLQLTIARLRAKLADEGDLIRSYLGVGYSLNV